MAKLLHKKGSVTILSDDVAKLSAKAANGLIKRAGTTSHQTREKSTKTSDEFIKMLQRIGHYSALEHSWFTFQIKARKLHLLFKHWYYQHFSQYCLLQILKGKLYSANSLFCITQRGNSSLLISGNSRMFTEAYFGAKDPVAKQILGTILFRLNKENPILFPWIKKLEYNFTYPVIIRNPELKNREEVLVHRAMTVEFNNCSRGMTHEDVRSRNGHNRITSYTQESTRYVDYAQGELDLEKFQMSVILPYRADINPEQVISFKIGDKTFHFTLQSFTNLMENWYRALRKKGFKPEEARQWLPIGIESQMVQTYNLSEWFHWFYLRTDKAAHPEIRYVAVALLREVQKRIPGVFNDFTFDTKEDGTEYAKYHGTDSLEHTMAEFYTHLD